MSLQDTGHKDAVIKVSLSDVKNLLTRMKASTKKGVRILYKHFIVIKIE